MNRRLFADTGYWIALLDEEDDLHAKAMSMTARYQSAQIFTSEMVLAEVLGYFGALGRNRRAAVARFVRQSYGQRGVHIVSQTPELFDHALSLYEQRPDKQWSLVDCSSFVICAQDGIVEALAYDHHFV